MIFCEQCRRKANWPRPAMWPYYTMKPGRCEICRRELDELYEMKATELMRESDKTEVQKTMERTIEQEYQRKAGDLTITIVYGQFAGREDRQRTDELRKVFVRRGTKVDWQATYELRVLIQQEYYKFEERTRDISRK